MSLPLSKLSPDVKESFICIGDYVEIFPLFGRKKRISLNRTHYQIIEGNQQELITKSCQFRIPSIDNQLSEYELVLIDSEVSSYKLRTVKGAAFKQNGNFCHEAYIQKGDELIIGHNKLKFNKGCPKQVYENDFSNFNSDLNILIEGETGVGKTTMAKNIHEASSLLGDFIHINLSSFPKNLLESELFGHVKGAFTGAIKDKMGALEQANGGTLFLDEIDSLPLDIQVKLLLFLDNKKIRPVGSLYEKSCDCRIIFASGRSLRKLVEEGLMRRDFYFRVTSGHLVEIPSLRDDKDFFLNVLERYELTNNRVISVNLKSFLLSQEWPGNIRQLYGHLNKKAVLSKSNKLDICELDKELLNFGVKIDDNVFLIPFRELKKQYFQYAFSKCQRDPYLAAKKIGVSVNTMKNTIR